jgi:hypothetical protein
MAATMRTLIATGTDTQSGAMTAENLRAAR